MNKNRYIEGLKKRDNLIIQEIYNLFSPGIFKMVRDRNGTHNDAQDVFQDAIMVVYKNCQKDDFKLTASFIRKNKF